MMPTIFSSCYHQRAYVLLGHQLDGIEHHAVGAIV
jgi:hypothetical protein